ncbi:MAG: hypothetical protein DRJ38_06610 [Thermoprotei archaeon]|nr:MAG: hypothetical protein DRJ38_06610 [Thermoprotei archaeon]
MTEKEYSTFSKLYIILVVVIAVIYLGCIFFGKQIFAKVALILSVLVFLVSGIFPYRYFTERELKKVYFNLIIAASFLLASELVYFLTYIHPEFYFFILITMGILQVFFYMFFAFCIALFINFWVVPLERRAIIGRVYLASFTLLIFFLIFNTYLYIVNGKLVFGEPIIYAVASSLDAFFIPLLTYTFHIFRKSIFELSWTLVLAGIIMEFLGNFGHNLALIYSLPIPFVRLLEVLRIGGYLIAGYGFIRQIF